MKKILTIVTMVLCMVLAQAQILEPIHWTGELEELPTEEGAEAGRVVIILHATIDEGWHLYTQDLPEDGPLPTEFSYGDMILEGGTTTDAEVHSSYDENFEMTLTYYEGSATFRQIVSTQDPMACRASVTYMACNDVMCLAPTTWEYDAATNQQFGNSAGVNNGGKEVNGESVNGTEVNGEGANGTEVAGADTEKEKTDADKENSLMWVFMMGLLAGLLAVFTPCVWPIIPMTVSFFLKRAGAAAKRAEKAGDEATAKRAGKQGLKDAIMYGLSIVIIYVTLGLLVTVIFGASALNAMSTNAVVNIIFFTILVIFAASFFGAFEITLPSSWSTKLDGKASSTSGFLSILLMAFTLVIVSFSCTGPIIGTLLVEAAGKSLLAPAMGMLGFAIALALPFSLFAMFPSMLKKLPKSGGWMTTFKVTLAFLELALSLKFLSVADLAYGWHILDREVFLSLWIVIFALLGFYLLGLISFPHDEEDHKKTSVSRFFLAVISLSFAIYMIPGLWGAPLRAISAFAPPMSTQDWVMTPGATAQAEEHIIFDDFDEGLAYAEAHDMPIFLDFNGYGCVNCRKMEAAVLNKPEVAAHMKNYVIISLIVDEKAKLDEPIVVTENGKETTLRTKGDKWSYLQRTEYGANAQPFYVQLDSHGNRLSDSYSYDEDIEKFLQWLQY